MQAIFSQGKKIWFEFSEGFELLRVDLIRVSLYCYFFDGEKGGGGGGDLLLSTVHKVNWIFPLFIPTLLSNLE